jgi:hypothetical protein
MREGELRSEINAALSKIRAYARDMEVRFSQAADGQSSSKSNLPLLLLVCAAASEAPGGTCWQQFTVQSSSVMHVV